MGRIERYIIFEVLKPLGFVLLILVAMFACFSGARFLAEAVTQTLGVYFMFKLIFLKTFIALEVLIPIALYVSVVIGLGRLHRDQEIIALQAAGVSNQHLVNAIFIIAIPVAIAVGLLSLHGRPWAYESSYILDARANADLNMDRFQAKRFYGNEDNGTVIYIHDKDEASGELSRVFYYTRNGHISEVTLAASGRQHEDANTQKLQVHLNDGYLYALRQTGADDELSQFDRLVKSLEDPESTIGYKRKAAATSGLLVSDRPADIAEVQWRLSRPVATILLALIAIPLSRSSPRQGKNEKAFTAALVFAVYYNLSGVARNWVEQGVVDKFPGIWWLHFLMLIVVLLLLKPGFKANTRG